MGILVNEPVIVGWFLGQLVRNRDDGHVGFAPIALEVAHLHANDLGYVVLSFLVGELGVKLLHDAGAFVFYQVSRDSLFLVLARDIS